MDFGKLEHTQLRLSCAAELCCCTQVGLLVVGYVIRVTVQVIRVIVVMLV